MSLRAVAHGVTSINGENGAITLTSTGGTITITPSGNTIDLEAIGGGGGTPGGIPNQLQYNNTTFAGLTGSEVNSVDGSSNPFDLLLSNISNPITTAPTNPQGYVEGGCDDCIPGGTTWEARIYSYLTIGGTRIYSTTYLDYNQGLGPYTTTGSVALTLAWTADTNPLVEGYIVVSNINGSGFVNSVDVGGATTWNTDSPQWPGVPISNPPSPQSVGGNIYFNYTNGKFYNLYTTGSGTVAIDSAGVLYVNNADLRIQAGTKVGDYATFGDASYFGNFQDTKFLIADNSGSTFSNLAQFDSSNQAGRSSFIVSNSGDGNWTNNFIDIFVNGSIFSGNYYPSALGSSTDAGKALVNMQSNGSVITEGIVGTASGTAPLSIMSNGSIVATFNNGATITGVNNVINQDGSGFFGANNFAWDSSGNITKIRGQTLSWPASNAAGALTNNGSGTLSWASGSSQWTTTGSNIYYNTGNVIVGATSGTSDLTVVAASANTNATLYVKGNNTSGGHRIAQFVTGAGADAFTIDEGAGVTIASGGTLNTPSVQLLSGAGLYRASYLSYDVINPALKWPTNTPDVGLSRSASGELTINDGSSGVANLKLGKITGYNGIATVSNGVPSELGTADLTGQVAAKTATTLYTPTATGMFRISIYLQVTTAASVSSVLGGAGGVVITYNDGDGNVAQTDTVALTTTAGAIAISSATNTTGTNLTGSLVIYARTGVAIQYAIGYTSTGTAMQYAAHLKIEAL